MKLIGKGGAQIGPHSDAKRITAIDGRTRPAKALQEVKEKLRRALGGAPTPAQELLIEATAVLWLRVGIMAQQVIRDGDTSGEFIAWQNSLRKNLAELGLAVREGKKQSVEIDLSRFDPDLGTPWTIDAERLAFLRQRLASVTPKQRQIIDKLHARGLEMKAIEAYGLATGLIHEDFLEILDMPEGTL